jgi:hypothetical protein
MPLKFSLLHVRAAPYTHVDSTECVEISSAACSSRESSMPLQSQRSKKTSYKEPNGLLKNLHLAHSNNS